MVQKLQAVGPILADYAQFEAGQEHFNSGNYRSAITEYNKILADYPDSLLHPRAYLMIGQSYYNLKDYARAKYTFDLLAENYPDAKEAAEARYLSAKTMEKQGNWKGAYLAYQETDLLFPMSLYGQKAQTAAVALKKAHRKKLPSFKANAAALFNKGMAYFEQDDFDNAAKTFGLLAREYPKSKYIGEAWLMLGRAEIQTNSDAAVSDLEKVTAAAPNLSGQASYYLGLAYGRRGNTDKAISTLKNVAASYPDSDLADDAIYWSAYYLEANGDFNAAVKQYYGLVTKYPYSNSVQSAIWRIGRAYYWTGDFKNAAIYLHLAQIYPPAEDTPRSLYFEAKALERQNNRGAAMAAYEKLVKRFDHTYYAYRAKEKLRGLGTAMSEANSFEGDDFADALDGLGAKSPEELAAIMEIWQQTRSDELTAEDSQEAQVHFTKYKELLALGLADYAAAEARFLVNSTSDSERDSAQAKLGEMLIRQGEFKTPIRFADRKVKSAILSGNTQALPKKVWQLAYPRGYWKYVQTNASSFGLDPYLVLAVIREESRFNPKATSRSGARGLMQIMPRTGRGIAKDLELARYRTPKLYTPSLNVNMGTYYLANLIKNFKNNSYLALAGYNGGPNKIKSYVKSWYNGDLGSVDIDEFVESIPSRETRLYVQKVMGSYFEYKRLYDRKRG